MSYSIIETELFEALSTDFYPAVNLDGTDCSAFTYDIISPVLTAPSFYVNNLSIRSEPVNKNTDLGSFDFMVEACLTNWAFEKINCVTSPLATYVIRDPCERTQIIVNGIIAQDEFVMYQTGTYILPDFLTSLNFPDTESIRISELSLTYPVDACGDNQYRFVSQLTNTGPIPFFSFDSYGSIYFEPTRDDDEGFYPLRILVGKRDYSMVPIESLDFIAEITLDQGGPVQSGNDPLCNDAVINMNNAYILDAFHLWGDVIATETPAFAPYSVTSQCKDLKIFYAAEYYEPLLNIWIPVPSENFELTFDANRRVFAIDKCGPISQVGDSECGTPFMYTKIYQVRVVATVNNMVMTQNKDLIFEVVIGPDCSDNEITLQLPLQNIDY